MYEFVKLECFVIEWFVNDDVVCLGVFVKLVDVFIKLDRCYGFIFVLINVSEICYRVCFLLIVWD